MFLLICLIFFYIVLLWKVSSFLIVKPLNEKSILAEQQKFSILIPFRNEQENLPALLQSIKQLNYPSTYFEVIFINDHSDDDGEKIISKAWVENAKILSLPDNETGKKAALKYGAANALYPWLIFTDADCMLDKNHLQLLHAQTHDQSYAAVYGSILLIPNNHVFSLFDAIETLLLQGFTAFGFLIKQPFLANGANWAVKKDVFINHQYQANEGPSGDDVFFLNYIKSKEPILYLPNWTVQCFGAKNYNQFINQKIRWSHKWKKYFDKTTVLLGLIFIGGQTAYLLLLLSLFFNKNFSILACFIFVLKISVEWFYAKKCSFYFKQTLNKPYLLMFFIMYPFYTLYIGVASIKSNFNWKGRTY